MVCPDDAWTGLAPHSAANDRSDFIRPGLSPAAANRAAAVSGPTPVAANSAGFARAQRSRISISSWSISASRVWYRRARWRRALYRVRRSGLCLAGTPAGTDSNPSFEVEAPELVF